MTVGLTTTQIDHICYQIGEWYLQWERKMWIDDKPNQHWLGFAKEQLKEMICGDEYTDNSEEHKTEIELVKEKSEDTIKFLENVSLVLGIVHGGIAKILESPDEELRIKLKDLFDKLTKDVSELYYSQPVTQA
jgi:hypothetical protein